MDQFNVQTYPKNEAEFLTMLYLQKEDISSLSPEELADRYLEILASIQNRLNHHTDQQYPQV